MIKSFRDKDTQRIFISGKSGKYPSSIIKSAVRKLDYLNAAVNLNDLRLPPGNRLESLKGKLK
ncbi:MAG: type II toxin-antitoxin system RelE/ParE family toxin, partial [Ignavibacteriae bacterium]